VSVTVRRSIDRVRGGLRGRLVTKVGFPEETTGGVQYEDGLTVAHNALIQTLGNPGNVLYGGPSAPIPARDFMGEGTASWRQTWIRGGAANSYLASVRAQRPQLFGEAIGLSLQGFIQEAITASSWAANSEFTISQKGSSQPLIDTGLMRQSVDYVADA